MAITLGPPAYEEFRCFGLPDEYPKDIRAAVTELRRRGYDASVAVLNYLVEENRVRLADDDRWSAEDIDAAASELADRQRYTDEALTFAWLGVDAGAPSNTDGTINLIHYAAWLAKEMAASAGRTHGD